MAGQSRFSGLFRPWFLIWLSIKFHYAAFKDAFRKDGFLASFTHRQQIRDAASAKLLIVASDGFIAYENTTVVPSLVHSAEGKILELGPGPGNQIHRYDPSLVEFIYAVEPSSQYGDVINANLKKCGLQDKYKLLVCGIEDSEILRREGISEGSMDTLVSIQVLCAVKDARSVMKEIWKLLKPGGSFIFWEHIRSKDSVTAFAQTCWNPAWSALVGCHMNRDILSEILAAGEWENPGDIEVDDDPYSPLPRISGRLKKKF